jgi:hypothetical protein
MAGPSLRDDILRSQRLRQFSRKMTVQEPFKNREFNRMRTILTLVSLKLKLLRIIDFQMYFLPKDLMEAALMHLSVIANTLETTVFYPK